MGEVIIGLLQLDPNSYLSVNKNWTSDAAGSGGGTNFRMTDFLRSQESIQRPADSNIQAVNPTPVNRAPRWKHYRLSARWPGRWAR